MSKRKAKAIKAPNVTADPGKSRSGNTKDGLGVVKGRNRKGIAFIFDPSKHKRDPLTGKWATKPDVVKPQKDRKKATKPTSSEVKKTKPSSPFAKFRHRVRDALKQQLLSSSEPKSAKPAPTDSVPTVAKDTKPVKKKNLTLEEYTQRGQEISSKYGFSDNKFLGRLRELEERISYFLKKESLTPSDMEKNMEVFSEYSEVYKKAVAEFEKKAKPLLDSYKEANKDLDLEKLLRNSRFSFLGQYGKEDENLDTVKESVKEFHSLTGGVLGGYLPNVDVNSKGISYASYSQINPVEWTQISIGTVGMAKETLKTHTFHEAAHILEYRVPGLQEAAREFLKKYSSSGEEEEIYYQGMTFRGYKGDFIDSYVGRLYDGTPATEVISTGFERLSSPEDLFSLYNESNHHFNFILGVLDNLNSARGLEFRRLPSKPDKTKLMSSSTQKNLDPEPEPAEPNPTTPKQVSKEYTDTINSAKSKISQFKLDNPVKVFETLDAQLNAEIKSLDPKNPEDVEKAQKLFARKRKLKQSLDIYLEKQMNLLYQELLDNNNSVNSDLLVGQTNFQIGEYTKKLKPANTEDPIYKTHAPVISKALAEFHKLTGGILNNLVPRIGLSEKKRSWAGFDAQEPQKNNYLSISVTRSNDVKPSVFHEAAHLLEGSDPKFANLAKEFLAKNRTSDELKQIKGYPAGEVAYPGNWVHPYVGKIYENAPSTEVISMGMERFASPRDMAEFYFKDKEHFALILGIIESLKVPEHLKPKPATIY